MLKRVSFQRLLTVCCVALSRLSVGSRPPPVTQDDLVQRTDADTLQVSTKDMDSTLSKASRAIKKTSKKVRSVRTHMHTQLCATHLLVLLLHHYIYN